MSSLTEQTRLAKEAGFRLAALPLRVRNQALEEIAQALQDPEERRLLRRANTEDIDRAEKQNLNQSLLKRLRLSEEKMDTLCQGLRDLSRLPDPLGRRDMHRELSGGLILERVSVPLGLVGVIFESRPDAFVQIASLCLKSGNAVILKGGSEAKNTNRALYQLILRALEKTDTAFSQGVILAESREDIQALLQLDQYIDLMIPRGSNALVRFIKENTRIPVLGHADGICHLFLDEAADPALAYPLTRDSKCQYPAVCNALETLLVHTGAAEALLPDICRRLEKEEGVELRGCPRTRNIYPMKAATEEDWDTEYNDLILAVRVVDSLDEAIAHINRHGSHHTDGIVSTSKAHLTAFQSRVDSASVMLNASTRFADGFRYGLGAEVGISTSKIHARGPVGLEGLTLYKYILTGGGDTVQPFADGDRSFTHKDL